MRHESWDERQETKDEGGGHDTLLLKAIDKRLEIEYAVATISSLLKIIGLCCKRAL